MPKITYLDPDDTGTVNWHGKAFGPNKAVTVDGDADAALIAAATASPKFWKVSGLSGDDKEAADQAAAEAKENDERAAAALQADEEAAQAAADAERAASEEFTKPGQTEAAKADAAPAIKKPGAR
jgi:autotransporter translocation and assembly factor TamB